MIRPGVALSHDGTITIVAIDRGRYRGSLGYVRGALADRAKHGRRKAIVYFGTSELCERINVNYLREANALERLVYEHEHSA